MIPDFQSLMLPILKLASDRNIHTIRETIEVLAKQLQLTDDDLNEWLPSKSQKKFYNYVYWAKAHLGTDFIIRRLKPTVIKKELYSALRV